MFKNIYSLNNNIRKKLCLNGEWKFKILDNNKWFDVKVPGSYTGVRSGWGHKYWDIWDYPLDWEGKGGIYKKVFTLPKEMKGKNVTFYCGGVRHHSKVMVNGKHVGEFNEGYVPFEFDITDFVKSGENEIKVRIVKEKEIYTTKRHINRSI